MGFTGERDVEGRFLRATREGPRPEHRPDLGPCLLWIGGVSTSGYGQFRFGGRAGYAHRYAWEREHGPIPPGLTIDHLCRVQRCVRASHLDVVTQGENNRRAALVRTTCPKGHEYDIGELGNRRCSTCRTPQRAAIDARRTRVANGLPDRRLRLDPVARRACLDAIAHGELSIREAATRLNASEEPLRRAAWREAQTSVRTRDEEQCVRCGVHAPAGDVHHRRPRGRGGSAQPRLVYGRANLVLLCRDCHGWTHGHPAIAKDLGLILPTGSDPLDVPVRYPGSRWFLLDDDFERVEVWP